MPEYTYFCDKCQLNFTIISSIKDYTNKLKCNTCGHIGERSYDIDLPTIQSSIRLSSSEIKTLGHLAQRNTEIMSQDHKDELCRKHNSYKDDEPEKSLPKGMKRLKKQPKIQWTDNPSKKPRRKTQ